MTATQTIRLGALLTAAVFTSAFIGCGSGDPKKPTESTTNVAQTGTSLPKVVPGTVTAAKEPGFIPFNDAVTLEAPDGENRPPDTTASGKSTAKLFETIAGRDGQGGMWDQIRFTAANGKRIKHFAVLKTEVGDVKIELLSDSAPNHVRSFICLAKTGYFDGLAFHTSIRNQSKDKFFGYLESGSPKGTNEVGYGSIGYWLKPEIKESLTHEEGTVGAWHPEELERAACRFYITLNKNPGMDGSYTIFGKVVEGLDVAHTINKRPVGMDEDPANAGQMPYRIRQAVIVETHEDGTVVAANVR